VATVFLDTQFKIRRFTPPATQLFNLISTDLGRPIADITRKFGDPELLADAGLVLRELLPREREVHSEGDRWWTRRVLPYRTLDDRIEGVAITFVDVTERRKAADIMVRRHAAVVESSADAIFSKDLDGTIRSWNRGAIKLYGYSIEEAVGRSVQMLVPSDRMEEWTQVMSQLARGEYVEQLETERIRKDGQRVPVSLTISPIHDADGNVVSASVISRDITERKRIEEELRRTVADRRRLEGQIVEIGLLEQQRLGAELHDGCGQDLTALGILAGGLIESLKARSPSDVEVAAKIGDGLKRVLQYIRDKAQGLAKVNIRPRELPGALDELTSRLAEKSGINWTYDDHEAVRIRDDLTATQLYHIAQEACTNALKHAGAQNVRVSLHLHDAHVILRIEDDGIGIPAESKDGLGMRIMQNRAAVIGGKLTVEPRQPAGTIVTCTVPVEYEHGGQ
jgi:two-component system CheB/CheR fusion protein